MPKWNPAHQPEKKDKSEINTIILTCFSHMTILHEPYDFKELEGPQLQGKTSHSCPQWNSELGPFQRQLFLKHEPAASKDEAQVFLPGESPAQRKSTGRSSIDRILPAWLEHQNTGLRQTAHQPLTLVSPGCKQQVFPTWLNHDELSCQHMSVNCISNFHSHLIFLSITLDAWFHQPLRLRPWGKSIFGPKPVENHFQVPSTND